MIECAYYTFGVIEVQYSQIDYVHIYYISIIKRPTINLSASIDTMLQFQKMDRHSHYTLSEPLQFSALLAFLSWEMSKVGKVVGKESHDCTEDSFIDILMFSCLQIAAYFSTYVCYKQALVYFQR